MLESSCFYVNELMGTGDACTIIQCKYVGWVCRVICWKVFKCMLFADLLKLMFFISFIIYTAHMNKPTYESTLYATKVDLILFALFTGTNGGWGV